MTAMTMTTMTIGVMTAEIDRGDPPASAMIVIGWTLPAARARIPAWRTRSAFVAHTAGSGSTSTSTRIPRACWSRTARCAAARGRSPSNGMLVGCGYRSRGRSDPGSQPDLLEKRFDVDALLLGALEELLGELGIGRTAFPGHHHHR